MSLDSSTQSLIAKIRAHDDEAVKVIWDEYFPRLVKLAGKRLQGERARQAGEEDVALSVMKSLVVALQKGRMSQLDDRDGLWRLLASMTRRKVIDLVRYNGVRPVAGESVLHGPSTDSSAQQGMAIVAGDELSPGAMAEINGECDRLLELLPRDDLRDTAIKRLEGYTVKEIAQSRPCHINTIERQLTLIRKYWQRALDKGDR